MLFFRKKEYFPIFQAYFSSNLNKSDLLKMMKCVVLDDYGGKVRYGEMPIPVPKSGQVLVKVEATTCNPSDLTFLTGTYGVVKPLPTVPGFECSGKVVKSGGGFVGWRLVGKRVACGSNDTCLGTWAEYVIADAMGCIPLDNDISYEKGACSLTNPLTVIAFERIIKLSKTKAVVQTAACSSLGKMLLRTCKRLNIPIINIIRRPEQEEMLKKLGAQYILNQNDKDFFVKLKDLSKSLNATVCFDAISGDMTGILFNAMPKNSIIHVYGRLNPENISGINPKGLIFEGKTIAGFWLKPYMKTYHWWELIQIPSKLNKLLKHELETDISKVFSLDKAEDAIDFYKKNSSLGKILLKPKIDQLHWH